MKKREASLKRNIDTLRAGSKKAQSKFLQLFAQVFSIRPSTQPITLRFFKNGEGKMFFSLTHHKEYISGQLLDSFQHLSQDHYLKSKECFRYRAFSEGIYLNGNMTWESKKPFLQPKTINTYMGGVVREFEPISPPVRDFAVQMLPQLMDEKHIPRSDFSVGCRQIRSVADNHFNGCPTPEGFHQDGVDYVVVSSMQQENVNGGVSMVSDISEEDIFFDDVLPPGEGIVIGDRNAKHYVSPMTPKVPGQAYRDVIVMTLVSMTS